jgi:hypothetical protein
MLFMTYKEQPNVVRDIGRKPLKDMNVEMQFHKLKGRRTEISIRENE